MVLLLTPKVVTMKVDLGQNVRLVFFMAFRHFVKAFLSFGTPTLLVDSLFSEVDSANCLFDSSAGLVCRFVVSFHRFVMSFHPFVMAFRLVHLERL